MELVRFQNVARQLKMFITRHNTFFNSDFAVFPIFVVTITVRYLKNVPKPNKRRSYLYGLHLNYDF